MNASHSSANDGLVPFLIHYDRFELRGVRTDSRFRQGQRRFRSSFQLSNYDM